MNHLRQTPPSELAGQKVEAVVDYASGVKDLPPANVLEFCLANGAKAMVRPSGTEPKMKVYLFARGRDRVQAQAFLSQMRAELERFLQ